MSILSNILFISTYIYHQYTCTCNFNCLFHFELHTTFALHMALLRLTLKQHDQHHTRLDLSFFFFLLSLHFYPLLHHPRHLFDSSFQSIRYSPLEQLRSITCCQVYQGSFLYIKCNHLSSLLFPSAASCRLSFSFQLVPWSQSYSDFHLG